MIIHTEPVPEKPRRAGAAEKVKAVAAAVGRRAAPAEQRRVAAPPGAQVGAGDACAVEAAARPAPSRGATDADDRATPMGYDLSRYEADTAAAPAVADAQQGESARLAAADDPDALGDGEDEGTEGGTGRRRSRRGGARRRTRP